MGSAFQAGMWILYQKQGDSNFLVAAAIFWLYVVYKIASFRLYRVRVEGLAISKRPFGTLQWQTLSFADVDRVEVRRLSPRFGAGSQVPTSRLELHARTGETFPVSLVHFDRSDLEELLRRIKCARPELKVPALSGKLT